eukprot:7072169-Pyramimonas_sp.AAC.1
MPAKADSLPKIAWSGGQCIFWCLPQTFHSVLLAASQSANALGLDVVHHGRPAYAADFLGLSFCRTNGKQRLGRERGSDVAESDGLGDVN